MILLLDRQKVEKSPEKTKNPVILIRPATAPEIMVAAVAANIA